jgi:hypothetical protein
MGRFFFYRSPPWRDALILLNGNKKSFSQPVSHLKGNQTISHSFSSASPAGA